ncbi:transglycosylase, partial [Stenotrophomonas maltophilia]
MKGILGTTAIIIAALTAAPASAGTLYKCQGGDGVTSYVSKRVAGARCSSISYSRDTRPAPRPVVAAPKPAPTSVASIERNPVAVAASAAAPAA